MIKSDRDLDKKCRPRCASNGVMPGTEKKWNWNPSRGTMLPLGLKGLGKSLLCDSENLCFCCLDGLQICVCAASESTIMLLVLDPEKRLPKHRSFERKIFRQRLYWFEICAPAGKGAMNGPYSDKVD